MQDLYHQQYYLFPTSNLELGALWAYAEGLGWCKALGFYGERMAGFVQS